jgi:SAM-dependent methyltransferase
VEGYEPVISFGAEVAAMYDDVPRGDEAAAVAFLEPLAHGGRALELAIGTGRIALPLAAEEIQVDGIDVSEPMVARIREKPGGERIGITMGDMAEVAVDGRYRLIYVVFNSLYNLPDQEGQIRCFRNVAAHLTDDGVFVVEAFTPGYLHRLRDHQYVDAEEIRVDKVWLDVAQHDPVAQRLVKNHVALTTAGVQLNPVVLRYAWPSELDLMARLAGLGLQARWGGWERQPFTADSRLHVSVWGRSSL